MYCVVAPGGGSGTATALFSASGFQIPASGSCFPFKVRRRAYGSGSPGALACLVCEGSRVTSGSAPNCRIYLHSEFLPHSREEEFWCLGLQSYSRRLCMSRGKHYRLYS